MLSVGMVTEKVFENMTDKGFENGEMKCQGRIDILRVHFRRSNWEVGLRWVIRLDMSMKITFMKPPLHIPN